MCSVLSGTTKSSGGKNIADTASYSTGGKRRTLTTRVERVGFRKYTSGSDPGTSRRPAIGPTRAAAVDVILYFRVVKPPRMANVREPVRPVVCASSRTAVPRAPVNSRSVRFSSKLVYGKARRSSERSACIYKDLGRFDL